MGNRPASLSYETPWRKRRPGPKDPLTLLSYETPPPPTPPGMHGMVLAVLASAMLIVLGWSLAFSIAYALWLRFVHKDSTSDEVWVIAPFAPIAGGLLWLGSISLRSSVSALRGKPAQGCWQRWASLLKNGWRGKT
jgi:hypothetical protein